MAGKKKKVDAGDIATNREARFRFELSDPVEAGMVLLGSEVKSMREGGVMMKDAYASIEDGEVWLRNLHIAPYKFAGDQNHEPERPRKLLLNRREIDRIVGKLAERGFSLIPTRIYFANGRAKVELALGRGKDVGDKRQTIKDREMKREIDRAGADYRRGR
ncbi:MAG: SsrA-binding protein SmpB [Solirubrobacterales bacterium]|nr:SsrA-binding protein SmpB [Solirubrobacterales bacterium]